MTAKTTELTEAMPQVKDVSGLPLTASKRLERATFQWPKDEVAVTQMSLAQLRLLLEGFELKSRRGWRRYEKRMSKPPVEEIVTRDL
jgi:transposase